MRSSERAFLDGVLVVDKPKGLTSHDIVAKVRRGLNTSEVGHAGTLDPMATGVLVVLVGEATKLSAHITADDKEYSACLRLGQQTTSLDADGEVTETRVVPELDRARVEAVFDSMVGTKPQRAPIVSAIKRDGVALHERVRRGESVEAPIREVRLDAFRVEAIEEHEIRFWIRCGKGYYVRSLGRDVAEALGTVGHLVSLRRERVGMFGLAEAVPFSLLAKASERDRDAQAELQMHVGTLRAACASLSPIVLTDEGVMHARQGKRIVAADIARQDGEPVSGKRCVLLSPTDEPVAIAEWFGSELRIGRGFQSRPVVTGTSKM